MESQQPVQGEHGCCGVFQIVSGNDKYRILQENAERLKAARDLLEAPLLSEEYTKEMEQSFPFAHRQHLADKEWIEREQQKIKTEIEETRVQKKIEIIVTVMEDYNS